MRGGLRGGTRVFSFSGESRGVVKFTVREKF